MFKIHKHELDLDAARMAEDSQGRISPSIKSKRQLFRTLSRRQSSFESVDGLSDDTTSIDEEVNRVDTLEKKCNPSLVRQVSIPSRLSLLERAKSKKTLLVDVKTNLSAEDSVENMIGGDNSDLATFSVSVSSKCDSSKSIGLEDSSSEVTMKAIQTQRPTPPQRSLSKKRDIILKRDSSFADTVKLDPKELDFEERENFESNRDTSYASPFSSDVLASQEELSKFDSSQRRTTLSRQNSQSDRSLSRQNSMSPFHRQNSNISRQHSRVSAIQGANVNITYDESDCEDSDDALFDNDDFDKVTAERSKVNPPKKEIILSVRTDRKTIQESDSKDTSENCLEDSEQESLQAKPITKEKDSNGLDKCFLVLHALSACGEMTNIAASSTKQNYVDKFLAEAKARKDAQNDSASEQHPDNITQSSNSSISSCKSVSKHQTVITDNIDDNGDETLSPASLASLQNSVPYSLQSSAQMSVNPIDYLSKKLSVSTELDPQCSMNKYSRHMEQSNFERSVVQYVSELSESTNALLTRHSNRRKVKVPVKLTPKMQIAKDVVNRKLLHRKLYQDKQYVRENRAIKSFSKTRGQTPMQRKLAAQREVYNVPQKYFVPADQIQYDSKANIEYLLGMVSKSTRIQYRKRQAALDTISLDIRETSLNKQASEVDSVYTDGDDSINTDCESYCFPYNYESADDVKRKKSEILDLFYMKKGLYRTSYLNFDTGDNLPEFIYISKQGQDALSERIAHGHTYLTKWDEYLIAFVHIIDDHVSSVASNAKSVSIKTLMSQLLDLPSPFSKEHRLDALATEFNIPLVDNKLDELHIFGEIYRKREAIHKRSVFITAEMLQKDIQERNRKFPSEAPSTMTGTPKLPLLNESFSTASKKNVIKPRCNWVKKANATTQRRNSENSSLNGNALMNSRPRDSFSCNQSLGSNSVMNDMPPPIGFNPIVDGSVTMSKSPTLTPSKRSQSATTRDRDEISLPSMVPPSPLIKLDESFFTQYDDDSLESMFKTTKLFSPNHSSLSGSLSFYKESTANIDDALYYHNDAPYVPWVPKGGMKLMTSDKSDLMNGWKERRDVGQFIENTKHKCVLQRANVIKESFETFSKRQSYLPTRSLDSLHS